MATTNDDVNKFVKELHQAVKTGNTTLANTSYEANWTKLTEKHFKQSEWPAAEQIANLVENGMNRPHSG